MTGRFPSIIYDGDSLLPMMIIWYGSMGLMGSVGSIGLIGSKGVPFSRDSNKGEDWSAMLLPMTRTVWYDRGFIANSENVRQLIFARGLNIRPNMQWFPEDSFVYLLTMLQCLPMDSSFVPKDSLFYLRCIIFMKIWFIMHIICCTTILRIHPLP